MTHGDVPNMYVMIIIEALHNLFLEMSKVLMQPVIECTSPKCAQTRKDQQTEGPIKYLFF